MNGENGQNSESKTVEREAEKYHVTKVSCPDGKVVMLPGCSPEELEFFRRGYLLGLVGEVDELRDKFDVENIEMTAAEIEEVGFDFDINLVMESGQDQLHGATGGIDDEGRTGKVDEPDPAGDGGRDSESGDPQNAAQAGSGEATGEDSSEDADGDQQVAGSASGSNAEVQGSGDDGDGFANTGGETSGADPVRSQET